MQGASNHKLDREQTRERRLGDGPLQRRIALAMVSAVKPAAPDDGRCDPTARPRAPARSDSTGRYTR